jgi:hypothetical protein
MAAGSPSPSLPPRGSSSAAATGAVFLRGRPRGRGADLAAGAFVGFTGGRDSGNFEGGGAGGVDVSTGGEDVSAGGEEVGTGWEEVGSGGKDGGREDKGDEVGTGCTKIPSAC